MKIEQYPITCWCGIPGDKIRNTDGNIAVERLVEMKDAGLNIVLAFYDIRTNQEVLTECEKLGLYVTVGDGRISQAIARPECREQLLSDVAADYRDYPALYNYHITDEPNAADFPALADVVRILKKYDAEHEGYINLFPNYASAEQLGNPTYREHVEQFLQEVRPQTLSYDHYHFMKGARKEQISFANARDKAIYDAAFGPETNEYELSDRPGFFTNIEDIRELSQKYKVPFMIIILVVEHGGYRYLTEAELRWEVWQSLAYGASSVSYFTYWTPGPVTDEWHWQQGMLTLEGEKTEHYRMVADINAELAATGLELQGRRSQAVFHIGDMPLEKVSYWPGEYGGVSRVQASQLTLGFFEGHYLLVANRDYRNEQDVTLTIDGSIEIYMSGDDEWEAVDSVSGEYSLTLDAGDALLIRILPRI